MVLTIGSEAEWAGAYPLSLPERKQNINCRIMRQLIFPVAKKAKRLGGKRHVLIQATLSTKLNGRTEWTVADAAVLFKEPVEDLVSDSAIEAISGGSEYRLRDNHAVDISRRELSAPAGSRTSVLNVQVLEDEHKSPLLKWDRTFSLSGSIRGGVEYLVRHNAAPDIPRYGVDPTGSSAMAMRRLAA